MSDEQTMAAAGGRFRPDPRPLAPGLYFVSTPIGAARDITLRALDILATADVLAAEDTRTLRHLMEIHGVALGDRHIVAYHDHNGDAVRPRLLRELAAGKTVAYASEAGTPLVADPGYQLSRAAIAAGVSVFAAPGASAVLTALTVAGLPSDRFMFVGFAPASAGARVKMLQELAEVQATLVFYESPKRVYRILGEMAEHLGTGRDAAVCRELTKRFEEVTRGTLGDLRDAFADRSLKGEVVILVDRAAPAAAGEDQVRAALVAILKDHSVKDAATLVAQNLNLARRDVYQIALTLGREEQ